MKAIIKTSLNGLLILLVVLIFTNDNHAQTYGNYNNNLYIKGNTKVRDSLFVSGGFAVIGADTLTPGTAFEVSSTNGGVLISKMDETQRDAISSPPTGLMIFNTSSNRFELYTGTEWKKLLVTGDVSSGSGTSAVWGDTIEGSTNHINEVLYFSPNGNLVSDNGYVRDSASHSVLMKADTQMVLLNNDIWGVPMTGLYRSSYGFHSIAGFMDLTGYGADSCRLFLGFTDPVSLNDHGFTSKVADSTLDIQSLGDFDIKAINNIDINSSNFFISTDTTIYITSDSTFYINSRSSFNISTQDETDYSFGISSFGDEAECCQNSASLFKLYEPYNMTVDAFNISEFGLGMTHTFNESSGSDYSENSIQIDDTRILLQANDSTDGEPSAFIRINKFGTIEFGYGFQSYTFPSYNGSSGQVLTTDGSSNLTWSTVSGGVSEPDSSVVLDENFNLLNPLMTSGGGNNNILLGNNTGYMINTGEYNVVIGESSGYNLYDGINNILIGADAGEYMSNDSNNIAIGVGANSSLTNMNHSIAIGDSTDAEKNSIALGRKATAFYDASAIGYNAVADSFSITMGGSALATKFASAIGYISYAQDSSVALGYEAQSNKYEFALPEYIKYLNLRGNRYEWPDSDVEGILYNDGNGTLNFTGSIIKDTTVTISSDSILVCNTRPQALLPAPGVGYYYDIISIVGSINFNTTAYGTDTGLTIKCENANSNWLQNVQLLSSNTSRVVKGWSYITPFDAADTQIVENDGIVLTTMMSNPTDGDSDISLNIVYRKVSF